MLLYGRIETMTGAGQAEAVYLEGDRIADVGSLQDLSARYPGAKKQFFEQITPGLHEAHAHPQMWGLQLDSLDLEGLTDPQAVAQKVAERARTLPPGGWIRGGGYLFRAYPTRELLDAAAPHHPVFLQSRDRHSGWANTRALEQAGITAQTPDPPGGVLVRDAQGQPTGYLLEAAQELVQRVMPKPGLAELERGLHDLARRGYTAVHHMGWCHFSLAEQLAESGRLPVRLWWALDRDHWREARPGWRGDSLEIAAVKFFADGALGSRTAWMIEPYPDGSHGLALDALELILSEGRAALEAGLGLVVHAIGTRAVQGVLEVFHQLQPISRRIFRLEHAQHVRDAELARLAGLNLALSLQPMHLLGDAELVRFHLKGQEHEAFRLRDLWKTGLPVAFGSDAPVMKPLYELNLQAATQHPLNPAQSLTPAEVLWAHTRGAALAAGWPQHGQIRPEAPADLTLWENGRPVGRVFRGGLEL
ncbi:amidohydrolase [Meiothermus ruber]|jgi:predicted amidohydrolase YtcJ|uniref:amidohydrolase n=1 Tax=Meiothermus ruber TaxID=277 RepID=UPI0003496041|nr:amidohydrolase [Meiothermus ruber]MCL6531504.1 amidohydrolase [Meiothermus ruber]GAO76141.1 amidohydrolase [Meiothermus ruber H328]